jgi:phosphonatase-like hydrolase
VITGTGGERPALVVFDLAGTTIRDRGEVPAAFREALGAFGLDVGDEALASWRGASKREVVQAIVAQRRGDLETAERQALASGIYERFRSMLRDALAAARGDLAIPGSLAAFERLHDAGIKVALTSGFDRAIVTQVLQSTAWPAHLLDAVVCSDDVVAGRPAPFMIFRSMELTGVIDVRRVATVGDTRLDLEAGANGGVAYRIGVLTGAHDGVTLALAPHTHILRSVEAVPDVWLGSAEDTTRVNEGNPTRSTV